MSDSRLINDQQIRDFVKSNRIITFGNLSVSTTVRDWSSSFNWAAFFLGTLWFRYPQHLELGAGVSVD